MAYVAIEESVSNTTKKCTCAKPPPRVPSNKTNRRTEFQIYWYYGSTCFGQPFRPSPGVLSLHQHWYILCSFDDRLLPGTGWNCSSILFLVASGHHNCVKCTNANLRLRTPNDGRKGCPEHVEP